MLPVRGTRPPVMNRPVPGNPDHLFSNAAIPHATTHVIFPLFALATHQTLGSLSSPAPPCLSSWHRNNNALATSLFVAGNFMPDPRSLCTLAVIEKSHEFLRAAKEMRERKRVIDIAAAAEENVLL